MAWEGSETREEGRRKRPRGALEERGRRREERGGDIRGDRKNGRLR